MVEFMVDMGCLLEEDELDRVVLHDENGEHPSMLFEPSRGTCHDVSESEHTFRCSKCDAADLDFKYPDYCHSCGAKVVQR